MFINVVFCFIGIIILFYSADKLVYAASDLAFKLGISKMAIGLVIVAAGTSLPEFVVSLNASIKGNPLLSMGNVVGSNIANIALIIGITALILPINSIKEIVRREVPIMIALSALVLIFSQTDSRITLFEGIILLVIYVFYGFICYVIGKHEKRISEEYTVEANRTVFEKSNHQQKIENDEEQSFDSTKDKEANQIIKTSIGKIVLFVFVSIIGLVIGSEALVSGAVNIALAIGVNDEVIGLTLVAVGTSLPELVTSVVAARKKQSALSIGNILGSNIFNITAIVGTATVVPYFCNSSSQFLAVSSDMVKIHLPIMLVVSVILLPIMLTDMKISRYEGAFLLVIYLSYSIMLFQNVVSHKVETSKPVQEQNVITPDSVAVE